MAKKSGRPKAALTEKEEEIMQLLWQHGPLFVREMVEMYPDPKPHVNTVATTVRILEQKGHVAHEAIGGAHRFYAVTEMESVRSNGLRNFIKRYFSDNYLAAVSALVKEEKVSVDELKELIELVETGNRKNQGKG